MFRKHTSIWKLAFVSSENSSQNILWVCEHLDRPQGGALLNFKISQKNFGILLNFKISQKNFGILLNFKISQKNFGIL
jgi:hypothetical protein